MIFPDGTVKEIDAADVATARSLGATEYVTPPSANGRKTSSMQFPDGQVKDVELADVAVAESLGAVKKKESGGVSGVGSSLFTLPSTSGIERAQTGIEDYNQQFENVTGYRKFDLSAPVGTPGFLSRQSFEKARQRSEQKKYQEYKADEEEINRVANAANFGSSNLADSLKNLAQAPYGKEAVKKIIASTGVISEDALPEDPTQIDFEGVSKSIIEQNRKNGVAQLDAMDFEAQQNVESAIRSFSIKTDVSSPQFSPGAFTPQATKDIIQKIPAVDFTSEKSLADAIKFIPDQGELILTSSGHKPTNYSLKELKDDLITAYRKLVNSKPIDPEIENVTDKIGSAITTNFMRSDKDVIPVVGEGQPIVDNTQKITAQIAQFKAGLNYIKALEPGKYKNIIRGINDKSQISETDYSQLSQIGQGIYNENVFKKAADDPSLIGAETNFDYTTKEERKAQIAGMIGELAKAKGMRGLEFSEKQIKALGRELRLAGDDRELYEELAVEEGVGGYDAIPKSGPLNPLVKGLQQPFSGIASTIDKVLFESPAETYLKSQRLDVGTGQKVPNAKGELSAELASDRNNVWYDIIEGTAQFIPQIFLTKGIGQGLSAVADLGALTVPRAALTAAQTANIVNYGGTFISQFLQTYGDAYSAALEKTGNVGLARLMGSIDAGTTAASELILPDVKIAEKAFGGIKGELLRDMGSVFKKGGLGIAELREKSRPMLERFVTQLFDIGGQEVSEEVVSNAANYLDEAIFSPATVKNRDFAKETWDTVKGTAIAMVVPAFFGGGGAALNKDFSVQGLHSSAINFSRSKEDLNKTLESGAITQQEYNNSLKLLSTHRNSLATAPFEDSNDKELTKQERLNYALQTTNLKILKEKLKSADTPAQEELLGTKIKEAEEIQRNILIKEPTADKAGPRVFTDFDGTLHDGEKLTEFGKQIKERVAAGEDITVLTSRDATNENIDFIADQIGIDPSKIQAGLTPEGKAQQLSKGDTFYDNDQANLKAASKVQGVNVVDSNVKEQPQPQVDQFRSDEEVEKLINPPLIDQDGNEITITSQQKYLPRDIEDPVTGEKKMTLKNLKTRAEALRDLITCLT